jgi:hypothetical protein
MALAPNRSAAQTSNGLPAVVTRARRAANPRIEITPSPAHYEQLCRDLKRLRKLGAPSHTQAIIEAVHAAAQGHKLAGKR